ncbi:cytidine deaminase 1-like [Malania oleifera]|uniref:cytidine deaminase 1-like n=1 Tax=Malania oleifera TaxID=397392 RepID=UPI0025AE2916|nr:cytidine deaminase 1-like [Malania oleifera]XP_057968820.1 cytidine deaminase 1-like [Malania oleifera]
MERPRFVIEPSEAESMAKQSGLSVLQLLPSLVKSAQPLARPSISNFPVGAVGLCSDGRIFLGVNLEFPGLPLHHSVHAEQFLVTNIAFHRHSSLRFVAVSSAPCGHCRQFLQEIRGSPNIRIFITSSQNEGSNPGDDADDDAQFKPLLHFLPHRFGPDDLLDKDVPLLLEPHNNGLVLVRKKEDSSCNGFAEFCEFEDNLVAAALEAANESHAPYSGCPSGAAFVDSVGKVYRGSYMESAAYNPSLGPIQAALVAYVASGGGGGYDQIVAGVLVEKEGAAAAQEHTARLLLQLVSPLCEFRVFHCRSASNDCKKSSSS